MKQPKIDPAVENVGLRMERDSALRLLDLSEKRAASLARTIGLLMESNRKLSRKCWRLQRELYLLTLRMAQGARHA